MIHILRDVHKRGQAAVMLTHSEARGIIRAQGLRPTHAPALRCRGQRAWARPDGTTLVIAAFKGVQVQS